MKTGKIKRLSSQKRNIERNQCTFICSTQKEEEIIMYEEIKRFKKAIKNGYMHENISQLRYGCLHAQKFS